MKALAARDSMSYVAGGYAFYPSYIFKTSDGGRSWTKIFSDSTKTDSTKTPPYIMSNLLIKDIAYLSNGVILAVADSNKTVTEKIQGGTTTYVKETGIILRSTDGGKTWISTTFGALDDINARRIMNISMSDSLNGIISQRRNGSLGKKVSQLMYTKDGGLTWNDASTPDEYDTYPQVIASPIAGTWIMTGWSAALNQRVLWRTEDYGKTWTMAKDLPPISALSFINSLTGYSAGETGQDAGLTDIISKTTDGGMTWTTLLNKINMPLNAPLQDISFADEMNGVAVGHLGKILHTFDGGITWQLEESGLEPQAIEHLFRVVCPTPRHAVAVGLNGKMMHYVAEGILEQPQWITPPKAGIGKPPYDRPIRLEWTAVVGAEKYELTISTNPLTDTIVYTNNCIVNNLLSETEYVVYVRAITGSDTSNWSKQTNFFTSTKPVSVENFTNNNSFGSVYPNPARDQIIIPFKNINGETIEVSMTDVKGKKVQGFKTQYSEAQNSITITALDNIPAGTYFIEAKDGNARMTVPVVIVR
ncbi:MAG TPA: T9SS type A sorting domain-containing protein [Patescibacteria group bacterium]|nr:T9SS type A sorting domain-containing protein [Patescibacteria group bacterium]